MLLTLLSAILFYLSFPNWISIYGFWPCIWIFAAPFFLALHDQPFKKRLGLCLLWGLTAYGLLMQGLFRISPVVFIAFVLCLGTQVIIFSFLARSNRSSWVDALYFPFVWSISEFLRSRLLGGFGGHISQALAYCPMMLKLYWIFGCLGMSFIIILVNTLIFLAILHNKHRLFFISAAGVVFLSVCASGFINNENPGRDQCHIRVSVIQANISPLEKWDPSLFDHNAALHLSLTEQAFEQGHPDLVIWPETAYPDDLLQSTRWRPSIFAQAQRMNADMLVGIAPIIDGKDYNSALLINAHGQVGGLYHKQSLVPFAETMPLASLGINWGHGYNITPGTKPGILGMKDGTILFGVMICSESMQPAMARQLKDDGAKFLVDISNDGWFTDKTTLMLHAQFAIMRAVENRMWVIRSANTGFSFAVDPNGVVYTGGNLKLGREGYGIFDIMVNNS